jgi:hypothetical protein
MKTKKYTAAMLIALVFATASIQAQSARGPANQEKRAPARTTATQPERKAQTSQVRTTQARNTQPVRKEETAQVRTMQARNTQPVRKEETSQVRTTQARNTQPVRKEETTQARRPVSMTTTKNPRSTYRAPTNVITAEPRRAPARNTVYRGQYYYGGHFYHYAYPTRSVKIHYHYDTYANHYHVLYYPTYGNIYWTRSMYRDYNRWYPEFHWRYNYGYMIQTVSVFDAKYNLGEVAMVYGRVYASWYNQETDDYLLFFGGNFPNQEFTAVVPGHVARRFNHRPERFFLGEHVTVTGLITTFDGIPEIVVKDRSQLRLY